VTMQFWFMFPAAILVATTAIASGVGGATFFAPIFMLVLGLPPEVAIGAGLITEVFGFSSGLYAYVRKHHIDYRLGLALLVITIPAAVLGAWMSGRVPSVILKLILGMGLLAVALSFLRAPSQRDISVLDTAILDEHREKTPQTCLIGADKEQFCYTVCNRTEGRMIAGVGGLFVGMISTGLGELNGYFLLQRCRVPSKVAVATSVFVVAITALSGAAGHLIQFLQTGGETLETVFSLVTFTVPGVVIGAQFGAGLADKISQHVLERVLGVLFLLIAIVTMIGALY